jgi:hypothetical protein
VGPVSEHGFFGGDHESNDREWDSNGQALWAFGRFDRINGPAGAFAAKIYAPYVIDGARWIRDNRTQYGLLPSAWSAEHIGDKDKPHYWDDLWAALGQQLLHIAVGQAIAQIPADRDRDHLRGEPKPGKRRPLAWGRTARGRRTRPASSARPDLHRRARRTQQPRRVEDHPRRSVAARPVDSLIAQTPTPSARHWRGRDLSGLWRGPPVQCVEDLPGRPAGRARQLPDEQASHHDCTS